MNIKTRLKRLGIPIGELAMELMLSRPTLDLYIAMFEREERIPKARYEEIFHILFDYPCEDRAEFLEKLSLAKEILYKTEKRAQEMLPEEDLRVISTINNKMRKDMQKGDFERIEYQFILFLLDNYRLDDYLRAFVKLIVSLNMDDEIGNVSQIEKKYIGELYNVLAHCDSKRYMSNELFSDFLREKERRKEAREKKRLKDKERLERLIRAVANDMIESGYSPTLEQLDAEIRRRFKEPPF